MLNTECSLLPISTTFLLLPSPLIRHSYPPTATFTHLVPWFRFVCSKIVAAYWDPAECLGVTVRTHFDKHDLLAVLQGHPHALNSRTLRAQMPKNAMFSLMRGNLYLSGPASLINHACIKHANCVLDFSNFSVEVSSSRLEAGDRLYYTYSDEVDMSTVRGIACTFCGYRFF